MIEDNFSQSLRFIRDRFLNDSRKIIIHKKAILGIPNSVPSHLIRK
jgi:hypothetical protein